jgi:poly(3-hydroxybutyrate) depolymerase
MTPRRPRSVGCNGTKAPLAPGTHTLTMHRPEGLRTYLVYVPEKLPSGRPVPLHLSFHGLGDTCQNQMTSTGFQSYADAWPFVFVTPCGTDGGIGTAWNAGTCCQADEKVDDVAFSRQIVAYLSGQLCLDPSNTFASGFSNGAMMSEVLACEAPDLIRAAASVSGVVELRPGNEGGLQACDEALAKFGQRASVLNVHGDADLVVPFTGDALLGFPDIPTNLARWVKRSACTDAAPKQTLSGPKYTNQIFSECDGEAQMELVRNSGGGHEWPQDSSFDTSKYIYEFFQRVKA